MIRLATNNFNLWAVYTPKGFSQYETIEQASEHLISEYNVNDDDIDDALIEMSAMNKKVAIFEHGRFVKVSDF